MKFTSLFITLLTLVPSYALSYTDCATRELISTDAYGEKRYKDQVMFTEINGVKHYYKNDILIYVFRFTDEDGIIKDRVHVQDKSGFHDNSEKGKTLLEEFKKEYAQQQRCDEGRFVAFMRQIREVSFFKNN